MMMMIMECKNKNKIDTSNNRGDWNHLKITQTIPYQLAE